MNNGEVLREGTPNDLIAGLKGKLWQKTVAKTEADAAKENLELISIKLSGGKIVLTVKADENPAADFTPKTPDLEDVYFIHVPQTGELN